MLYWRNLETISSKLAVDIDDLAPTTDQGDNSKDNIELFASDGPSLCMEPSDSLRLRRIDPGTETLRVPTVELDPSRPGDGLGLSGRRGVFDGIHLEGAFTLSTEWRKDMLLFLFTEGLALPGEEVQEKHQR